MKNTDHNALQAQEKQYQYNRISFWLNGKALIADIPPAQTTLEFLNREINLWGTKCSCNEGDCGACTVVVASPGEGGIVYEAVNSCLYTAAKLHGRHLITIEGLGTPDALHPIQSALLEYHATQCGYCTPGFVMSLFALLATTAHPDPETILATLEGNLCRCTGYDSILKAAEYLSGNYTPEQIIPEWCRKIEPELLAFDQASEYISKSSASCYPCQAYYLPHSLDEYCRLLDQVKDPVLISGGTDIMVQMNIQRRKYPVLIDLSSIEALDQIGHGEGLIRIGAKVRYTQVLQSELIQSELAALQDMIRLIASQQIRNFSTLAGNIANASPIGDTLPLLLVLDTELELSGPEGARQLPLSAFFLSYRKTALKKGEIISAILIPPQDQNAFIRSQKAAKRKAVDISSVASAVLILEQDGIIKKAELALGGVAEIPKLSRKFKQAMLNMELQGLHPEAIADFVAAEFTPISDVRGSREYRSAVIRNQVLRYLNEFLEGRR